MVGVRARGNWYEYETLGIYSVETHWGSVGERLRLEPVQLLSLPWRYPKGTESKNKPTVSIKKLPKKIFGSFKFIYLVCWLTAWRLPMRVQTEDWFDRKDSKCNHPGGNHCLTEEEFPFFNISYKEGVYSTIHACSRNEREKSRDKKHRYGSFKIACC